MKMKKLLVKDYIGMTVGIFLLAVSLNMFLVPNKVAAGGISGFATVLYHLTGWPVGIVMLVFNIPLFFYRRQNSRGALWFEYALRRGDAFADH